MSFNAIKRKATDENFGLNIRRSSVRSCIQLCLYYSGSYGYQTIKNFYRINNGLDSNELSSLSIHEILKDLTDLREKSKHLLKEYNIYRKQQKQNGFRMISKKEKKAWITTWEQINQVWVKFENL